MCNLLRRQRLAISNTYKENINCNNCTLRWRLSHNFQFEEYFKNSVVNTFVELRESKHRYIVDQLFLYLHDDLYVHQMLNYNAIKPIVRACKNVFGVSLCKACCTLWQSKTCNLFFSSISRAQSTQLQPMPG